MPFWSIESSKNASRTFLNQYDWVSKKDAMNPCGYIKIRTNEASQVPVAYPNI
jgi:hypothetical protein